MVAKRQCSFCAQEIEPGTGTIFVKRDGTVYQFCSSSCRKQQMSLGRIGHRFKWTRAYELKRAAERSSAERSGGGAPAATPAPKRAPRAPEPEAPAPEPAEAATAAAEPAPAEETPPAKKPRAKGGTKPSSRSASHPPAHPAPKAPSKPTSDDA